MFFLKMKIKYFKARFKILSSRISGYPLHFRIIQIAFVSDKGMDIALFHIFSATMQPGTHFTGWQVIVFALT